jgi:hypothetical protein
MLTARNHARNQFLDRNLNMTSSQTPSLHKKIHLQNEEGKKRSDGNPIWNIHMKKVFQGLSLSKKRHI